jgi:hypothetical protein
MQAGKPQMFSVKIAKKITTFEKYSRAIDMSINCRFLPGCENTTCCTWVNLRKPEH